MEMKRALNMTDIWEPRGWWFHEHHWDSEAQHPSSEAHPEDLEPCGPGLEGRLCMDNGDLVDVQLVLILF